MDIFHKMCANFRTSTNRIEYWDWCAVQVCVCVCGVRAWIIERYQTKRAKNHLFCGVQSNRVLIAIDLCFLQNCRFLVEICLHNPINVDLNHRDLILQSNDFVYIYIWKSTWLFANICPTNSPSSSSMSESNWKYTHITWNAQPKWM